MPTNQTVLNYEEKGDFAFSASIEGPACYGFSAGYAVTDHIAINSTMNMLEQETYKTYKFDSYIWDNELILFDKRQAKKGYFIPTINLGYGIGEIRRNSKDYGINVNRVFVQPSIGYKVGYFEIAGSLRLTSIGYNVHTAYVWDADGNNMYRDIKETYQMPRSADRFFFREPAFTIGYGYGAFRGRLQMAYANQNYLQEFDYLAVSAIVMVNVRVNALKFFGKDKL